MNVNALLEIHHSKLVIWFLNIDQLHTESLSIIHENLVLALRLHVEYSLMVLTNIMIYEDCIREGVDECFEVVN